MNLNKLGDLTPGDCAEITGFCIAENGADADLWQSRFLNRLHEIGFLVGEKLEVLDQAPISRDPISVRIKNAVYAVRRQDANSVLVKRIDP